MSGNYRRDEDDYDMAEEEEPEYEVEAILEKKKVGPKWKYFIKWVGYPHDQNTWEPEENLSNVKEMLQEFEDNWNRKQKEKEKKLAGPAKPSIKPSGGPLGAVSRPPLKESKISNTRKREDDDEFENLKSTKKRKLEDEDSDSKPQKTFNLGKPTPGAKSKKENSLGGSTIMNNNSKPLTEMLKSKTKELGKSTVSQPNSPKSPGTATSSNQVLSDGAIFLQDDDSSKIFGSFDQDDNPKRLLTAKLHTDTNEVKCLVEWEARKGGVKPADSFVSNKVLRQRCPQLLLDFYESRLRFPAGK
jgi:hypothetical protein